jgi:hypothetical protein
MTKLNRISPSLSSAAAATVCASSNLDDVLSGFRNKRRHDRAPFTAGVQIFEMDDSGTVTSGGVDARAFDLSRSGIGLHARRMYYAKSRVLLCVTLAGGERRALAGIVKYTRYLDRGLYHIGVEFGVLPTSGSLRTWCQQQQITIPA